MPSGTGFPPGVASTVKGRSGPSLGQSQSRCFASPASAVPLGTPTGVLQSFKGVGDGPNFLRGQAKKRWGLAKGVGIPLDAFFVYFLSHHRK